MEIVLTILSIIYTFWPLTVVFAGLTQVDQEASFGDKLIRRLENLMVGWSVMGVILLTLVVAGEEVEGFIPDPWNVLCFLLLGVVAGLPLLMHAIPAWRHRKADRVLEAELESLRMLSPGEFETLIARFFESMGYRTSLIEGGQDHGVDVLVYDGKGEKWVVQCKRYKGTVGEPILRDLLGTMLHERATRAFLMTTGRVSYKAHEWISDKPITIYQGEGLVRLLKRWMN